MLQLPLLVVVALLFGIACTTVDSLKAGIPRGVYESGFMKTTEGLSLKVTSRSYDEVWAAAEKAMSARLTVIDRNKERGVLRGSDADAFGFIRSYVGIFITRRSPERSSTRSRSARSCACGPMSRSRGRTLKWSCYARSKPRA